MRRLISWKPVLALLAGLAVGLPLVVVTEAGADDAFISTAPVLSGVPQVGQTLTATAGYSAPAGAVIGWSWERCTSADPATCAAIAGNKATDPAYKLVAADKGAQLRVRLTITVAGVPVSAVSSPTPVIVGRNQPTPAPIQPPAATPTPTPTATSSPTPAPTSSASGGVVFEVAPPPSSPGVQTQTVASTAVLTPFPVVRLRGTLTSTGARITELAVTAPRGAKITVLCEGRSCPRKVARLSGTRRSVRLRTFERPLRAGTRISIRVARKGFVGKRTLIRIRKGAAPKRADLCLSTHGRTIACPAA